MLGSPSLCLQSPAEAPALPRVAGWAPFLYPASNVISSDRSPLATVYHVALLLCPQDTVFGNGHLRQFSLSASSLPSQECKHHEVWGLYLVLWCLFQAPSSDGGDPLLVNLNASPPMVWAAYLY